MTTRSRKLGKVRVARLDRYHVGTQKLTLSFDLPENLEMKGRARQREKDPCQGEGRSRTGNCRSSESSEHSEGSQRDVIGKSGDLKEEARDLHLETAEMRSELNKKRVEKSLINDEVDGRLVQRIGHRLRLRK